MNHLTLEELAGLSKKVKTGEATDNEMIKYLNIVNGLLGEFIDGLRSMPIERELEVAVEKSNE